MENKFRRFLVNGTLLTGGIFFIVTFVIYHMGCSERTLVYWSLLTVLMYLAHIVLKLSFIQLEQTRLREDIMEVKLKLIMGEWEESLEKFEKALNEAKKRLNIKDEEETDNK